MTDGYFPQFQWAGCLKTGLTSNISASPPSDRGTLMDNGFLTASDRKERSGSTVIYHLVVHVPSKETLEEAQEPGKNQTIR